MGSINIKSGGAWRVSKSVNVKSGGAWRAAKEVWVRSGGVWRKAWTNGHTVTLSTLWSEGSGYASGNRPSFAIGVPPITAIVSGGSASFTYRWTAVRQQGNVNLTGSSGGFLTATLTPRIAGGVGANAAWDGYAYCDVTDTATGVVVRSANATINLFIESDGGGGGGGIEV